MKKLLFLAAAFFLTTGAMAQAPAVTDVATPTVISAEPTLEGKKPVLDMYHSPTCVHCQRQMAFLPVLEVMYPDLDIRIFDLTEEGNPEQMNEVLADLDDTFKGTPTNVIGGQIIVNGFSKAGILRNLKEAYGSPILPIETAEAQVGYEDGDLITPEGELVKGDAPEKPEDKEFAIDDDGNLVEVEAAPQSTKSLLITLAVLVVVVTGMALVFGKEKK